MAGFFWLLLKTGGGIVTFLVKRFEVLRGYFGLVEGLDFFVGDCSGMGAGGVIFNLEKYPM